LAGTNVFEINYFRVEWDTKKLCSVSETIQVMSALMDRTHFTEPMTIQLKQQQTAHLECIKDSSEDINLNGLLA